ncbi:MAG: hypothetical protein CMB31_07585 [Euryarchaeota archaeon]|nr:hypothetical protein [Euryarchaeota archaeon]
MNYPFIDENFERETAGLIRVPKGSRDMHRQASLLVALFILASVSPLLSPISNIEETQNQNSLSISKSVTTWSGVVQLQSSYTVQSSDELRVLAGTSIEMPIGARIYVEGRLTVLGEETAPVVMLSGISTQSHEGLQFNTTSNNRGSVIRNLTIDNADFGVTIYGSNPFFDNLTVLDPDYVGVDLFSSATPIINNLHIDEAGQDLHGFSTTWRYGIGLSIGASSAPLVTGLHVNDAITRGVNVWGGSGGLIRDVNIQNVTSATQAIATGIWVEDSILLFENVSVNRSDHGVFVRHITETSITRPTFRDLTVENSMYVGIFVERYNHSLYSNIPMNAQFENLVLRGTGGPNSKAPGQCTAAFNINTSGVYVENGLIEENDCIGFRGYMMGPSTTINGLIVHNSGDSSSNEAALQSGFYLRSANWAPTIDNLQVSGSIGAGIHLMKSSLRGSNWNVNNNSGVGLHVQESHPEIEGLHSSDNGLNGVFVYDSSNVLLVNASSARNGAAATGSSDGFGFLFQESNTLTASTKDVTCRTCSSTDDSQGGIMVQDSIDLVLENQSISLPSGVGPAIRIDNSGISFPGVVTIAGMSIYQDESSTQAVAITSSDVIIDDLVLTGNHTGIIWSGTGSSGLNSHLNNSFISGQNCLLLSNHANLTIYSPDYSSCSGGFTVQSSKVSFVNAPDASGLQLTQPGLAQTNLVQWISSSSPPSLNQGGVAQFDVMWKIHVWAVNQNGFGLPYAVVNLSFDQIENPIQHVVPYAGNLVLGPFVGTRTTSQGTTNVNQFWTGCEYSAIRNDTGPENLNMDKTSICEIQLPDQPPLILWSTPIDEQLFPSGGEVIFNASESWDLENQELTFSWNSSLDGSLISSCLQGVGIEDNKSYFTANNQSSGCLSDGTHDITLEVCDTSNNCASETRRIELTNLPPSISVVLNPLADVTNRILLSRTQVLHVNASASIDPENQPFQTSLDVSFTEWADDPGDCSTPNCPLEYNVSFEDSPNAIFDLTFVIGDGLNTPLTYVWLVELYNELPTPDLQVSRDNNLSSSEVTLDARGTIDPEGDQITYRFHSNIDGDLNSRLSHLHNGQNAPPEGVWVGHLSPGPHTITLGVGDSDSSHSGSESTLSMLLIVNNSVPIAAISSPATGYSTDSSDLIRFDSSGSGDWDLSCDSLEDVSLQILCNPYIGSSDLVSVLWTSNQLAEPLGSGWIIDSRLPAGIHDVTLTVDDGSGQIAQSTIRIDVAASAPLLILDSPVPGAIVNSDAPVLFDFRQSYDPDGDSFNVTITSDIETEPMVENGTIEFWYNDYMAAGDHTLTFTLTDENGMSRVHTQLLQVLPSDPFAVIANVSEGTSIPPGGVIEVIGADSYDYDNDIFRYEWRIDSPSGTVVSTMPNFTYKPTPGLHLIHLTVIDQRGAISTASVNITSLSSSPRLSDLMYEPSTIVSDETYQMVISVILEDPDGTTNQVQARIAMNGVGEIFALNDNGSGMDTKADDGIWTGSTSWTPTGTGYAKIEAWATDGDSVSLPISEQIEVKGPIDSDGLFASISEDLGNVILAIIVMLFIVGGTFMLNRRRNLQRDLDLIESWSSVPTNATQSLDGTSEVTAELNAENESTEVELENQETESDKIRGSDLDWDSV